MGLVAEIERLAPRERRCAWWCTSSLRSTEQDLARALGEFRRSLMVLPADAPVLRPGAGAAASVLDVGVRGPGGARLDASLQWTGRSRTAVPMEVVHDPTGSGRHRLLRDLRRRAAMGARDRSRPRRRGDAGPRAAAAEPRHAVRAGAARHRPRARAQGARSARRDRSAGSPADGFKVKTEIRHDEPASALRDAAVEGKARPGRDRNARAVAARAPAAGLGRRARDLDLAGARARRCIPRTSIATGRCAGCWCPTDFSEEALRSAQVALDLLGARGKGELILVHAYHMPVEYSAYGTLAHRLELRSRRRRAPPRASSTSGRPSSRRRAGR